MSKSSRKKAARKNRHKKASVENTSVENTSVENASVENAPVENTSVENTPVENTASQNAHEGWKPYFPVYEEWEIGVHDMRLRAALIDNHPGIVVPQDEKREEAACFVIDRKNAWVRTNWHNWYRVDTDENSVGEHLEKARFVKLGTVIGAAFSEESTVPVYHVDRLPDGILKSGESNETSKQTGMSLLATLLALCADDDDPSDDK